MFKHLLVFRLLPEWQIDLTELEHRLQAGRFTECGATQPASVGWVSPRGLPHAPLVESIQGQWLMQLMVEQKLVPASVVRRRVEAMARRIEDETGRAPGKKHKRELKDQALLELLPQAFTRQGAIPVWLSPAERLLVIDAASPAKADEVLKRLADALPAFGALRVNCATAPATAMAAWLLEREAPPPFSIDRDCELKAPDGEKPAVRYARHPLAIDEVREHLRTGKQPTRLSMTWNGRVSFELTEGLQIKKLAFLDGVFERQPGASRDEQFDTDAAISTGELIPLIGDLIDALGGEEPIGLASAPAAAPGGKALPPAAAASAPTQAAPAVPPWEDAPVA